MVMSEFNADGDVTGPYDQVKMIQEFCKMLKDEPATGSPVLPSISSVMTVVSVWK